MADRNQLLAQALAEDVHPMTLDQDVENTFGLQQARNPERAYLLPRRVKGEWLSPQILNDIAHAVLAPSHEMVGGDKVTPEDALNFAMMTAGGGLGASAATKSVPKGAIGSNVIGRAAEEAPLEFEALQPTDRPRLNWPEEPAAPRELTRETSGRDGRVDPGAPAGVSTPQARTAIANNYLAEALAGAPGRDWYDTVERHQATTTGNLGGTRPGAQDALAGVTAAFSPRASLPANRLAAVRAFAQHNTGEPIAAGMGPRNEAARSILEDANLDDNGLKVSPFGMQMRGLDAPRGVHDTRDMQAFGFERGFSPSETNHRWMDMMTDRMVDRANEAELGGFTDWEPKKIQAARWIKHKADEEGIPVDELARAFHPYDDTLTSNIYSEAIPSKELSDLVDRPLGDREAYTDDFIRGLSTPEGGDALALQAGYESPRGMERGVGEWEGNLNPNIRSQMLVDPGKGSDEISPWGKTGVDFVAGLKGLLGGQADTAFSYTRPAKGAGRENSARVTLDHPATGDEMVNALMKVKGAMGDKMGDRFVVPNIRNENQIELTMPHGADKDWRNAVKSELPGAEVGHNSGGLTLENFGSADEAAKYKPSLWLQKLQNPKLRESVQSMLPTAAANIEKLASAKGALTETGRDVYLKTLGLLKSGGLEAVEDAVKKGILPAMALAAIVSAAGPQGEGGV